MPTRSRPAQPGYVRTKIRHVPPPRQGERRRQGAALSSKAAPRHRAGSLVRASKFRRFRLDARLSPPRFAHRRGALLRRHCRRGPGGDVATWRRAKKGHPARREIRYEIKPFSVAHPLNENRDTSTRPASESANREDKPPLETERRPSS